MGVSRLYFESGELAEQTIRDSIGRPVDYINYTKDGKRSDDRTPIVFRYNYEDSMRVGEFDTLFVKLGNVDDKLYTQGELMVTFPDEITKIGSVKSTNSEGFKYRFQSKKEGTDTLYVQLHLLNHKSGVIDTFPIRFSFFSLGMEPH